MNYTRLALDSMMLTKQFFDEFSKLPASNKAGYSTLDDRGVPRIKKLSAAAIPSDSSFEEE